MHMRRSPSGDGPRIYRPNESVAVRLEPAPRPVAYDEDDDIPPPPRDTLLSRVNRRRGQILTVMVSVAAVASFASVVWWAHNQDVNKGGKGLEPLVVQASPTPVRVKPDNAGGMVTPNQDKEVFNRVAPGAVSVQQEKLLASPTVPKLPATGMPTPSVPKAEPEPPKEAAPKESGRTPTPQLGLSPSPTPATNTPPAPAQATPAPTPAAPPPPQPQPTEAGPSIASLIDNISGPVGGWRVQMASVKSEDIAKSTWARLQNAHGDVLGNLRMQPVRVDLGDKGVWYRVQAGPLDERQAQSVCGTLKSRKSDCVVLPPAR